MASGGARARSGPAPDPAALRRDRPSDAAGWITLPGPYDGPVPDWPLAVPPSPAELTHWAREWTRPQAHQWAAQGQDVEVALYVRRLAEAEIPGAAVGLTAEVRLRSDALGISLDGLAKRHWRIADAPSTATQAATATATPSAARPARRGPSSRDRFRVVKPPEEE